MATIARGLFERLGPRYLASVYVFQVVLVLAVVLAGVAMLFLYEEMTMAEFLRIAAVAEAAVLLESVFAVRVAARLLEPVKRWLAGSRDAESTIRAWRALAELPIAFLRRWKLVPPLLTIPPVAIFAAVELDASPLGGLALLVGAFVVLSYGATLRYFFSEIAMRPLLEDVAGSLPEEFELGRGGVALRLKLLVILPAINVITGVVVAGVSGQDTPGVTSLGVDVLLAIAVASTISLELTLLLSKSILDPIGRLRDATERVAQGDLSARVRVISTDETGRLAQSFNRMAAGLEERERLWETFGTFVEPEVVERVMREGSLLADELEVSVLFVDIRDFTAFAEQASAREVVERLNDFYERVVPVLRHHGGHANKFVGDGLLAVFGAPERLADHADRAVAAALDIAALVRDCYGDDLRVGIGVNSGPVLAGTVGGGGRLDFTVIGDPVNTAARVEEATRETGDVVLITGATRALLSDDPCEFDERPDAVLKGKAERVRLYAPTTEPSASRVSGDGAAPAGAGVRRAV